MKRGELLTTWYTCYLKYKNNREHCIIVSSFMFTCTFLSLLHSNRRLFDCQKVPNAFSIQSIYSICNFSYIIWVNTCFKYIFNICNFFIHYMSKYMLHFHFHPSSHLLTSNCSALTVLRNFPQGTISDMVKDVSQGISFVCNNIYS